MPLSSRRNLGSNKPSDSELSSIDKKEISSRQANDRRLSQAINYLVTKGGEDSLAEFKGIVCKIDKYIVQQYVDEGYSFDPELYQQLQIMIEEQLDDFRRSDNRSIHPPSNRGSDSVKEVNYGDTLPRGDSDWDYGFDESLSEITEHLGIENQPTAHSKNATVKPRPFRSETSVLDSSYGTKSALHVERQWRYGGPNNEPEKYHKDHLPILPFSETFYMPESQKSKGDLAKSVSTETTDDPIAHTAVGRSKTEKRLNGTCDLVHESGSQFGLPRIIKRVLKFIPEFLDNAVADFNNGDTEAKIEKDYAPRIFLERIKVHPNHGTRVGKKLGRDTTLHSNNSGKSFCVMPNRVSSSPESSIRQQANNFKADQ
jgi:hypothetical protein